MEVTKEVLAKLESKAFKAVLSKQVEAVLTEELETLIKTEVNKSKKLIQAAIAKVLKKDMASIVAKNTEWLYEEIGDSLHDSMRAFNKSKEGKALIAAALNAAAPQLVADYLKEAYINIET